jgi:hypothetical protein
MIDPDITGTEVGSVRFPIERSKLAELARSFGDDDPIWHDPDAARSAGFEEVPMQPTTTVIADHWRPGGATEMADAIGADLRRLLHGGAAWEFLAPLRLGAELSASQRVEGVSKREGKRGGTMTMVRLVTDYTDADGQLVIRRRDTLIERGA